MNYVYEISKLTETDLESTWLYTLENWSLKQANQYYSLIITEIRSIFQNPKIGKAFEEIKTEYRIRKVQSHLIV